MGAKQQSTASRQRHIPQRMCITCRTTDAKRGLFRVVRDATGRVTLDPTGKQAGRGAYLCHTPACWEQAVRRQGLARALRITTLHEDDSAALLAHAHTLAEHHSASGQEDHPGDRPSHQG